MKRKIQSKNIRTRRFITVLLVLSLLLMGMTLRNEIKETQVSAIERVVLEGETLWSIAENYNPEGRDIRSFISEIAQLNTMNDKMIYPGQVLQIPIY